MTPPLNKETVTLYQFGGFTLDLQRRGLYKEGKRIHLTSKPFEILISLIENRGRPVEKRELIDAVWNGVYVTEDSLVQAIVEIRRALGDNKDDPRFIKTVPRQGYRFVSEVFPASSPSEGPTTTGTSFALNESNKTLKDHLLRFIKETPKRTVLSISAIMILLVGVSACFYVLLPQSQPGAKLYVPFQKVKLTRITTSGKLAGAAVSPDGRYVIYALRSEGQESLWLKQVATGSDVQITKPTQIFHRALTFSPDGSFFYYVIRNKNQLGELFQMPMLGGTAKKVLADIDSTITISPDGKQISFFRGYPEKNESTFVICNADGTQEQEIAARKRPDFFPTLLDAAPAWSPGGEVIACPAGSSDETGRYMTVVEVQAAGGAVRPITSRRWWQVGHVAWLRDGSGLIMNAKERASDQSQIWYLSYSTGEARRITNDLNNYIDVSVTRDDPPSFVTIQSNVFSSILISPDESNVKDIPISSVDGVAGISWTPDGQIVYASRLRGDQNLYIMDQDGSNQRQLTVDSRDNNWPSVSSDGRYIVFMSDRTGSHHIWRMNIDGSNPKQLSSGGDARWPRCTPDNKWVVYASLMNPTGLFKVSIDGGDPVQLTDKAPTFPAISPDGRLISVGYFEDPGANKTAIYSFDGGTLFKIMSFSNSYACWTPDGRSLAYINRQGIPNIVSHPMDGRPPRQLTYFTDGDLVGFDWSRDGKLACSRKVFTADAVMISD